MNTKQFQMELALLPVVEGFGSLPPDLLEAARNSDPLRALVEERIRADRLLLLFPEIEPPAGMAERIVERALQPASRGLIRILRPAAALAAAALLLVLGMSFFRSGDPGTTPEAVDPELMASLDLLLDWETIEEHGEELDLLACGELAGALDEFDREGGDLR
ncbi:MAG: hypothetical protein V2A76_13510 [Planctomycetota bacterium]